MNSVEIWVRAPAAKVLGWTLVHSVWEDALIAVVLAGALCVIRSSRARYAAACLAMLGMLAVFGLTFARLMPERIQGPATADIRPIVHGSDEQLLATKGPTQWRPADFLPWLAPF